jgi:putative membrane protein
MKALISLCLVLTCILSAGVVVVPGKDSPLAPVEVKFMETAAQSSLNAIYIATLGTKRSLNPELKQLASTLISDHTAAMKKAQALAGKKGLALPTATDESAATIYTELEAKKGNEFDAAFLTYLDKSHLKSIKFFEESVKNCRDEELKAWLEHTLLIIKAHHERIKKLKPSAGTPVFLSHPALVADVSFSSPR